MRLASVLVLLVTAGSLGAAGAEEVEDAGRAHFEAARRAFDAGEYDQAVADFLAAHQLKPYPGLLINIAQCYERIYKPDLARAYYERFVAEAPAPSDLTSLAEKRLRVLRQLPGSILVDAERTGARVELSGGPEPQVGRSPHRFDGLPPGDYKVHVSLADYVPIDVRIRLAPGETHALNARLAHQVEQLTLLSVPDGARVFLDDHEEGTTPFSRSIETGHGRRLRLEAPDYLPYSETVDLVAGHPVLRRINLPRPRRSGRTEMVLGGMAFGGFAATGLTVAIGGPYVTTGTGLAILLPTGIAGVGLGFLTAWALTDDAMKVGHSSIIVGSTLWGVTIGTTLAYGLGLTTDPTQLGTQRDTLALGILGGGFGMGAGLLTAWLTDTSAGDAALVNSGGLWGTASGVLLGEALSVDRDSHDRTLGFLTLGTTSLGLVAGAVMARYFDLSRAHVAIIDAAGLLGGVLGYGIGYAAGSDIADPMSGTLCPGSVRRCVSGARYSLGGMAVGLIAASLLTRRFKADLPRLEALVTHHRDSWSFGLPEFHVSTVRVPEGLDRQAILTLARGEF